MSTRVAINGFGRIGRLYLRAALKRGSDLQIVAVNDITDAPTLAHLFKYDSIHGIWPGDVSAGDGDLIIDGHRVKVLSATDISLLPWRELGVDVVVESTGRYTERAKAAAHLDQGAKKVLITRGMWNGAATGPGAYQLIVPGKKEVGGYHVQRIS